MLLCSICAPYLFTFFDSLGKCLFGNKPWPNLKIFSIVNFKCLTKSFDRFFFLLQVFILETLHSFGLAIFVFHLLPKLDAARSLLMMNAVCLVPSLMKLFLTKSNSSLCRRSFGFLLDFFAFAMQCSSIGIALASKFLQHETTNEMILNRNQSLIDENLQTILAGFHIHWELPVALILVSLTW